MGAVHGRINHWIWFNFYNNNRMTLLTLVPQNISSPRVKRVVEKYFNLDIIRLSKQLPPLALLLLKDSRGMNLVMIVVIYKHRVKCWDKTWDSKKFLFFRVYIYLYIEFQTNANNYKTRSICEDRCNGCLASANHIPIMSKIFVYINFVLQQLLFYLLHYVYSRKSN